MKPVTPPPDPSSLQWSALPRGRFTGLDWNDRAQREGADPYLIWAETVGLSTQRRSPSHAGPQRLSLLIELAPDCSPLQLQAAAGECLRIPDLYTRPTGPLQAALRYCTAEASPAFFARSQGDLAPLLRRYELSMARGTPDGAARVAKRPPCASGPDSAPGLSGKVLGVIDGGLAFAHPRFRAPAAQGGGTRVAYFWCQDPLPQQAPPPGLHYGSEITAEEINAAVQASVQHGQDDEAQVYRQFGMGLAMDKRVNHGTHVLDIAAGPRTVSASVAGLNERYEDYGEKPALKLTLR